MTRPCVCLLSLFRVLAVAVSVLYIPYIFDDLAFRVGNPLPIDVAMGTVLIVALLEGSTRRACCCRAAGSTRSGASAGSRRYGSTGPSGTRS